MRQEGSMEGAYLVKPSSSHDNDNDQHIYPLCPHCKKTNHPQEKCWWRPDIKCYICGQLGHMQRICKSQQQGGANIATTQQNEEEYLFAATCFVSSESWLINSSCTNHMTNDHQIFKELDMSEVSKVRIGNGKFITVKGKGTVAIESYKGTMLISDVLYVPEIDQNLLSVGQLVKKGFKVIFENKQCLIKDANDNEVFRIKMRGKSFSLDLLEEEQAAIHTKENNTQEADLNFGDTYKEFAATEARSVRNMLL